MVCSVASSGKGGSNWLDRLRSNKGFPIPDNVLDSSSSTTSHPPTTMENCCPCENPKAASTATASASSSSSSSFGVISGILSDLFYITPSCSYASGNANNKKKLRRRKQSSPHKILSNLQQQQQQKQQQQPPIRILSSNSRIPRRHQLHKQQQQLLSGFSKTELTVIDTSSHLWKSDKLIFRRKHIWKIKDKTNNNTPNNQEYDAEQCSGPVTSANAQDGSNDKKENAYSLLQENGSYDPDKSGEILEPRIL